MNVPLLIMSIQFTEAALHNGGVLLPNATFPLVISVSLGMYSLIILLKAMINAASETVCLPLISLSLGKDSSVSVGILCRKM